MQQISMNYFWGQIFDITSLFSDLSKALRRICPGLGLQSEEGIVPTTSSLFVSKAFVFMMNFLSVLHNVPNEPRVNNSIKTPRHTQIPPITNKTDNFDNWERKWYCLCSLSRTINQRRSMWGTMRTTNYLAASLWGLSWCFMLIYLCSISHTSQQELVLGEKKKKNLSASKEEWCAGRLQDSKHTPIQVYL